MGDIESKLTANNGVPSAMEFFVHISFYFLGDIPFIGAVSESMVDYMLGLMLHFSIHFGVFDLDSPFVLFLIHLLNQILSKVTFKIHIDIS